ncbi:SDR family oxidoreductase [Amycolatopsis pithecellobii]|uniref:SDR family oxidoreductase n=1 Tax=Amycolatopsis pithecellobii TaxID=664692 RepID=A0A6N7Z1N9_9PSEU|nr:SDR family oxidoreductase [Amycolatopsis pithecellobii]MTD53791.1 SDR family oxidoreductase [Amycolatopsis pithecellobii]
MSRRLQGKKAFITGAALGIGRASAEAFAREGATVIATDVDAEALAGLDGLDGVTTAVLDVTNPNAIKEIAGSVGPVDVLFNVAAIVHHGSVLDCSDDDWDMSFAVNAKSVHRTVRAFLPGMLESGGGSIINVASTHGLARGGVNRYAYTATKGAIAALTRAIALDFVRQNIRCNCIAPGPILSPSLLARLESGAFAEAGGSSAEEALQQLTDTHPMGRLGETGEVAALAVFLASDESSFITGTAQLVDGGWSL